MRENAVKMLTGITPNTNTLNAVNVFLFNYLIEYRKELLSKNNGKK